MNIKKEEIVIVEGVGDVILDLVERSESYEAAGNGILLCSTEDIDSQFPELEIPLRELIRVQGYNGLILLRR